MDNHEFKIKRERAANWTEREKERLLEIIKENIDEIEDKKTDVNASKRKDLAWKRV